MDAWIADLPNGALRLQLTLEQALGSGMTAFIVVGRAMIKYPDFPWGRLNILTSGELANCLIALTTVNGNPYNGFNRTMEPVRSTLYSSIAYVAKELLGNTNPKGLLYRSSGLPLKCRSLEQIKILFMLYLIRAFLTVVISMYLFVKP